MKNVFYFIVSGEIRVYLVKIKAASITSEMISYHFTSDLYDLYCRNFFFFVFSSVLHVKH